MLPDDLRWPITKIGEGLSCLVQACRWTAAGADTSATEMHLNHEARLDEWVDRCAQEYSLEAEPVRFLFGETEVMLRSAAPALLRMPTSLAQSTDGFLVLLRSRRHWVELIAPDRSIRRLSHATVHDLLWQESTSTQAAKLQSFLTQSGVHKAQSRMQRILLGEMLGTSVHCRGWLLRLPPGAPLGRRVQAARVPRTIALLLGSYVVQLLLTLLAWWLIGRSALTGEFTWSGLGAWVLVLLSTIPLQQLIFTMQRQLVVRMGEIFKTRLLAGVLRLEPEEIRHQGAGHFLGHVLAADAVEQLVLAGGLVTVFSVLQLGGALLILALAVGNWLAAVLLMGVVLLMVGLGWRYAITRTAYADSQNGMTNALLERMVGHRTRLIQEDPNQWHVIEDKELERNLRLQIRADWSETMLAALPRGWMLLGLGAFLYTLVLQPATPAQLALTLGGILLAYQAFTSLVTGSRSMIQVQRAWKEIEYLFTAASRPVEPGLLGEFRRWLRLAAGQAVQPVGAAYSAPVEARSSVVAEPNASQSDAKMVRRLPSHELLRPQPAPLLKAEALQFRFRVDLQRVLDGCTLHIESGQRILLTGASGSGKSTLATLLAGLRRPEAGSLTLSGSDQRSIGADVWRRRVVLVPQFHENFVFTGSLAFNLLMGRRWPPTAADLLEAEEICRELGLGNLIERMPAGLEQVVGESGWRLSHGERSRIFIARALLQRPELLILDESFGALDVESLRTVLGCVVRRAPTLLVIAHQ